MNIKTLVLSVVLMLASVTSNAQPNGGSTYANPKNLVIKCYLASMYGNTNDSWSLTIYGLQAAFWDNNEWSIGKYTGFKADNTFGPSANTYGDGKFFQYSSTNSKDKWNFWIGPTYFLEGNKVRKDLPFIYGHLKVPGQRQVQVMECRNTSVKEAKEAFEYAREEY